MHAGTDLVDWAAFARHRAELGPLFIKVIGYFREDGQDSLMKIEAAVRANNAAQLVAPAHKLKGEARQVGAVAVAARAERIEDAARYSVESKRTLEELIPDVVLVKQEWAATMAAIDAELSPVKRREPGGFGRKAPSHNQGFGRL